MFCRGRSFLGTLQIERFGDLARCCERGRYRRWLRYASRSAVGRHKRVGRTNRALRHSLN